MNSKLQSLALASAALLAAGTASAQDNLVKIGLTEYTTHSSTNGVTGIGVPAGADAQTGNATTVILVYERLFTPNVGVEFVLGIPPRVKSKATGSVAFLGDDVLSAKNVAPTLFLNYHFGAPGDTWRPYLGAGINYTRFVGIESKLAPDVKMSDSTGWAAQAGIDYALNKEWSLFASVAALKVKSKVVASGATVLQTTIDFRPIVYSFGTAYRF
ncbi:MAG TPA: OmpW family outer membrane protein [Caldimonas sp.]